MKTRFFTKGWGQMSHLRRLLEFKQLAFSASGHAMLNPAIPPEVRLDHKATTPLFTRHQGSFESPLVALLPGILPSESHTAHFELVMPVHRSSSPARRLCILLGGTGEHYYSRRRSMLAVPLAKRGIASIILENPFYGLRKPKTQFRSSLHYLSDLFTMGLGVIAESALLFNWAERQLGMDQLGVQGFSLGGHMAALVGSALERPLVCVPCLSAATARDVFVDGGVMRSAVDWRALQSDYSPPLQHLLDSFAFISPPALLTRAQHHKRQQQHQDGAYDIEDAMRILLDEATNLTTTRPPRNCTSTSLPHAPHDAYIPHPSSAALIRHWCPARSPPLSGGHVSSYLFCHGLFVDEIALAFDRL